MAADAVLAEDWRYIGGEIDLRGRLRGNARRDESRANYGAFYPHIVSIERMNDDTITGAPALSALKLTVPTGENWRPVTVSERYTALDLLRGFALFGVLLVNLLYFFRLSLFDRILHFHSPIGTI